MRLTEQSQASMCDGVKVIFHQHRGNKRQENHLAEIMDVLGHVFMCKLAFLYACPAPNLGQVVLLSSTGVRELRGSMGTNSAKTSFPLLFLSRFLQGESNSVDVSGFYEW